MSTEQLYGILKHYKSPGMWSAMQGPFTKERTETQYRLLAVRTRRR